MSRVPGGNYGIAVAGQSIYDRSATPKATIGHRLPMGDRVYYYGKVSLTVARGELLAPDESDGGPWTVAVDGACVAIASPTLGDKKAITAALAIGDRGIGVTHASYLDGIVAHQLQDGYIFLNDTGGVQQCYKIRDNTAMASDIVEILLYDEVRAVTIDASCSVSVMQNPFMNLALADQTLDETVAGVAMAIGTTTYPYIWVQTWGPASVTTATSTAHAGTNMIVSTTAGAATIETTGDILPIIGFGISDVASAGDGCAVMLRIRP